MATETVDSAEDRFLLSGDEAGTAPGDRPFRPDVEGLRAVAVLLVVLFHAGLLSLSGGYVGVDVFFVISGFVITGVLLRERASSGRTSILAFYGRRCRRIIPAACLVLVVSVVAAYVALGPAQGASTATDARWASVFVANFHFTAIGTDYLGSQGLPSLVQNFWSLSVEEQFYLVYPAMFVLIALGSRTGLRARLAIGLTVIVVVSFAFSIADTASHPVGAYFSPFTRAWELALGALMAVSTPWLLRVPARLAALTSWLGLGAVVVAGFALDARTAYPGSVVAVPVVGAALVIGGGVRAPRWGAESLLGRIAFRIVGQRSYSLYLWHWPILMVVAERSSRSSLAFPANFVCVLVAFAAAALTYRFVENPIRHSRWLVRIRWRSVALGLGLTAVAFALVVAQADVVGAGPGPSRAASSAPAAGSMATVLRLVAVSNAIRTAPSDLQPPLSFAAPKPRWNLGQPPSACVATVNESKVPPCVFGDTTGSRTLVLYGDSHAAMWFQALDQVATRAGWRLVVLTKLGCLADPLPAPAPGNASKWPACDQWHQFALGRINALDPDLLVVSQAVTQSQQHGDTYTPAQWGSGLRMLLNQVRAKEVAVIGNIPDSGGPVCVEEHARDIQACARQPFTAYNDAEQAAAGAGGGHYIDVTPWFCAARCSPVIGNFDVYFNYSHVAVRYTHFLQGVLAHSLGVE